MSEGTISIKKAVWVIVVTWILSMITTLAIVYVAPNIFPIGTAHINDEAVTKAKVADNAIITTKLMDGSVTSAKILDGTLTAVDLDEGCVVSVKVADGAVTTDKIDDNAVTTNKIDDDAIVTIKLADGSVTSAKILDGTVTAIDLATNAVTALKIKNGAITTSKIADEAVTNTKLAPQAIPFGSTHETDMISTTETVQFVDMTGMSISLSLERTSHILIMVSVEAMPDWDERINIRVLVDQDVAYPGTVFLNPIVSDWLGGDSYFIGWGAYTFNFYEPSISPGTYTIKVQWQVSGGLGDIAYRTLTVIALPA